ncbi:[FeFe] hydrogenase H-cluster radical SAM maturase HydE [Ferrimonas senticii]|uniref:[FeFe] hydrogenase H-cluster radical SAM maturase HydE n=1 Tax=Ferrimonas senticii TaxID=394566 RepID=UPI0003F78D89|nr:[FeFe] hydrogenase H-cluster radical SAM maturase HydE [Ferrimonas senticii]
MSLNHSQLLNYLSGADDATLFAKANAVKQQWFGNEVYLRGIVEFSNFCRNNCHYCGLRRDNRSQERYRIDHHAIMAAVDQLVACGLATVVLQSGDDFHYSGRKLAELVAAIKARHNIAITLSVGDRSHQDLSLWRAAGADRYLLKMESFDRKLFAQIRPQADFDQRIARLQHLKAEGYQVGSGIIVGLPQQTLASIADDILALTELQLDMLACGPFIAHPQTPFAGADNGSVALTLRITALLRLLNPGALIPATSALKVLQPDSQLQALCSGANVVMPSFTPLQVSGDYQIYPGKNQSGCAGANRLTALVQELQQHQLTASFSRGDSKRPATAN